MFPSGYIRAFASALLVIILLSGASLAQTQQGGAATPLEQGKPVECELAGGKAETYLIKLSAGQFLRAVVEQRGIDVVVRLYAPDGKQLLEVDSPNGTDGPEPVSLIASVTGEYRLEVRSLAPEVAPGRYVATITELRVATETDRTLAAAEKALSEGEALRAQGTLESLKSAIQKFEEAIPLFHSLGGLQPGEASAINSIGEIYFGFGERQKALDYFTRALALRRSLKDQAGEALMLNNVAVATQALGNTQQALEYFTQALALHRATGNRYEEAITLNNLGHLHDVLGDKQKALDYYNQALPIRRALGDHSGEAYTLNNTGLLYLGLGETQRALDYFTQSLPLWRATGNRAGEATTVNNIAYTYDSLGDQESALKYYNESLILRRAVGDRSGEAETLNNLGLLYDSLGERQKALDHYNQAIPIFKAVGNPYGEATTYSNIGLIYTATGEYQKALDYLNQSLPIRRNIGDRTGESYTLNNIGLVYLKQGEAVKAADLFTQALTLSRAVSDRRSQSKMLFNLARLERDRNNLDAARTRIEEGIQIIESIRTKINSQQLRATYFASVQDFYMLYIDILMRLHKREPTAGHDAEALQASERARARILLEMLVESGADIRQGVEPALLERESVLQKQLNAAAEAQTKLLLGAHTDEQAEAAAKELERLSTEYQAVQSEIRAKSPRYAALTQPAPLDLRAIQSRLLDRNTMLLEYALGEDASYLWAVTEDSIKSYVLPKRADIEASARRLYTLITATRKTLRGPATIVTSTNPEQLKEQIDEEAANLSRMLLLPAAADLGKKRLLIVADGALQYIPFGALPLKNTPLIVEHEIVTLPSASTLDVLRREVMGRRPAARAVAVFADPVFESDDVRLQMRAKRPAPGPDENRSATTNAAARDIGVEEASGRIPRLPGTRVEAEEILSLVPQAEGKQALDFSANRTAATSEELSQYRIIHFATHGFLNSVHPELSGIVLSMFDDKGTPQDGFLRSHEIFNLRLASDLVVLSACRTGLGKEVRGEGLVGLTRGFMYAGSPRVVVSLWNVSDAATAELMGNFYQGMLKERLTPAAALRQAQISMWRQKRWQSPYYWAAFTLQGEWR
ncbi:MAG: CHAT domain-containing protein [Acidobacteria bacterium]|nr:CHAT domain-containing protein [Acidobacteriota bacterium]